MKPNIVLVPGLFTMAEFLSPLRERLETDGFPCWGPGFHINMLVRNELSMLRRRCQRIEPPIILIGHSAGGYLAGELAREQSASVIAVIGLGAPIFGPKLPVPYYEARSLTGALLPSPADERRVFLSLHSTLPFCKSVQEWVVQKCNAVTAAAF